ncbi:hypothetical protein JT358_10190 [Micrococcales bacterium 31B]|nr:hypothetical protein [Micrococcales bacterium 31B]
MTPTLAGYRHVREMWRGCHEFSIVRQGRTKSVCDEPHIMVLDLEEPIALEAITRFQGLRVAHVLRPLGGTRDLVLLPYVPHVLAERLAERAVPPPTALLWLTQIAEALVGLHAQGVIHGELSATRVVLKDDAQAFLLPTVENDLEPSDDMFGFGMLLRAVWRAVNPYRVQSIENALLALAHECCDLAPHLRPTPLAAAARLVVLGQDNAELLRSVARERLIARANAPEHEMPSLVPQPPQPAGPAAFAEFIAAEAATERMAAPSTFVAGLIESGRDVNSRRRTVSVTPRAVTPGEVAAGEVPVATSVTAEITDSVNTPGDVSPPADTPNDAGPSRPVVGSVFARWRRQAAATRPRVVKVGKQYSLEPRFSRIVSGKPLESSPRQLVSSADAASTQVAEDDLRHAWLHSEEKLRAAHSQRTRRALVGALATVAVVGGVGGYVWQSVGPDLMRQTAAAPAPALTVASDPAGVQAALPTSAEVEGLLQRYAKQRDLMLRGEASATAAAVNVPGSLAAQSDASAAAAVAGARVTGLDTTVTDVRVSLVADPGEPAAVAGALGSPSATASGGANSVATDTGEPQRLQATARVRVTPYVVERGTERVAIPPEDFTALFTLERSATGVWLIAAVQRI